MIPILALVARAVYAVPFLLFILLKKEIFFASEQTLFQVVIWLVLLGGSCLFYAIGRFRPWLMTHFLFAAEFILFNEMYHSTGESLILLFIIPTLFFTIDVLRNEALHIACQLLMFATGVFAFKTVYGIDVDIFPQRESLMVLVTPVFCRAVVSMLDKEAVVRIIEKYITVDEKRSEEGFKKKNEGSDERKLQFFKDQTKALKEEVEKTKDELSKAKREYDALYVKNVSKQEITQEITKKYFQLLEYSQFDFSKTFEENIDNILLQFARIMGSKYVAMITKSAYDENGMAIKDGEIYLSNSVDFTGNKEFDENAFVANEAVSEGIMTSIFRKQIVLHEHDYGFERVAYIPIAQRDSVKGVLVQCFSDKDTAANIHYYNMALMVAYHIYNAFQHEFLYRQALDESSLDPIIGVLSYKYFAENLPVIFSTTLNYNTNLALMLISIDGLQDVQTQLGDETANSVLRNTAAFLKDGIRSNDMLFRFSWNTLAVLMANATKERLDDVTYGLSNRIKDIKFDGVPLKASVGCAICEAVDEHIKNANDFVSAAMHDKDKKEAKA